jgi:hypothetical protein
VDEKKAFVENRFKSQKDSSEQKIIAKINIQ